MARQSWWIGALLGATFVAAGSLFAEDSQCSSPQNDDVVCATDNEPHSSFPGMKGQSLELPCEACCSACDRKPGVIGYADYLNWKAGLRGLDFVTVAHAPLTVPPDPLATESLNFDDNSGIRAGLGYRFSSNWDITWSYTYFRNDARGDVTDNGLLNTVLLAPHSVFDTTPMAAIQADASLWLSVHDFEANYYACLDNAVSFRMFGGVRIAELDQEFETAYTFLGSATRGRISLPSKMDAAGGRLGAEIRRRSESGWRVFGRGGISCLSADFRTQQREAVRNQVGLGPQVGLPQVVLDIEQTTTRFVSVLEGAAGIGWERGPLEIDAGYEMNSWINILGANGVSQDLLVRGFFIRLAYVH